MQNKTFSIFICVFIVFSFIFCLPAGASYDYNIESDKADCGAYFLYNYENKLIMAQRGVDDAIAPASTAKMMTSLLALELIDDTSRTITVTEKMLSGAGGRSMSLKAGDRLSLLDLLYATICGGYNDSAVVLANYLCNNEEKFVEKMNEKAILLGLTSTVYKNSTGLDKAGAKTSVADIVTLSNELIKNELFREIASSKSYSMSSSSTTEKRTIQNRSTLLNAYYGILNLSFGSSSDGYSAVHYFEKDGLSYLCVVMNALEKDKDDVENYGASFSKELLSYALYDFTYKTLITSDDVICTSPLKYSITESEIELYPAEDVGAFLPDIEEIENELEYNFYTYEKEIQAPVKAGETLGMLLICRNGEVLAKCELVSKNDYEDSGFLRFMDFMKDYITSRYFVFAIITFAALMTAYYFYHKKVMQRVHRSSKYRK